VTFSGQDISGSSDEERKTVTHRLFKRHTREEFIRTMPNVTPADFFWGQFPSHTEKARRRESRTTIMAPIRPRDGMIGGGTSGRDTSGSCDREKAAGRETRTTTMAPTVIPGDATFSGWDIRGVPMRKAKPS
jgi:hypothetical protein